MHSEVSELSPVLVELKVEVPWERVQQHMDASFERIAKTARIRGFRPGKAPQNVVRQMFGRQVQGEVSAQLIEEGLVHALQEHELLPVGQPEIESPSMEKKQPLTFKAKVEVRPKIDEIDLSGLEIDRPSAEVKDEDVDQEVEKLREQHAELRAPEPMRPAKAGDQLLIDYDVDIDGQRKEEMGAAEKWIDLGGDRLLPEFEKGLAGAQPGETRKLEVSFGDDHGHEELRGKKAVFEVRVRELREKILPEVDDEFAKDVGDYETLLELRLKIREGLEKAAEKRARTELKDRVIEKLVETNEVPVPPSMVRQQEHQMLYELAAFLQMSGQDMPMTDDLHANMQARAERRVRAALLLGALARKQGIEIGDEDVESRFREIAEKSGKHIAKVRVEFQGERREALESELLEEKLMDFLVSRAKIKEGTPPTEAEPKKAEPKKAKAEKAKPEKAEAKDGGTAKAGGAKAAAGEPKPKKATAEKAKPKKAKPKKGQDE